MVDLWIWFETQWLLEKYTSAVGTFVPVFIAKSRLSALLIGPHLTVDVNFQHLVQIARKVCFHLNLNDLASVSRAYRSQMELEAKIY